MTPNPLTRSFERLLKARALQAHFRSSSLSHALGRKARGDDAQAYAAALSEWARAEEAALFSRLESHPEGLTEEEARARWAREGANALDLERPPSIPRRLWLAYRTPFSVLLSVLALISGLTGDALGSGVILLMVFLATVIRFVQELKSSRAAEQLKAMVRNTAAVQRRPADDAPPVIAERPVSVLVRGDVIHLAAGDMIPADCRLLASKDLFINQAALTGESMPVEKFPHLDEKGAANPLEAANLVFTGSNVVSGTASAIVLTTGVRTYFGHLAQHAQVAETTASHFQAGMNSVSWLLIRFMLVMVPLVLLINGFGKGDWLQATLFALSIAVGLTPEMLPMIVTTALARGAVSMASRKVVVKRLDAIQNFGAIDVLCTDKTGTLTQDKVALILHVDAEGRPSRAVLEFAFLNSYYQTGLRNLLDVAVLERVEMRDQLQIATRYRKIDEVPFDFQRRRMSVVVEEAAHHHELICKGAVDEVMAVCAHIMQDGQPVPLDEARRQAVRRRVEGYNAEGLRVIAVAMRELPMEQTVYSVVDERELTLIGFVAFLDPPKESARPALEALRKHGVRAKVLTGDNTPVTRKVCLEVGLDVERVIEGPEIEAMDDAALARAVEQCDVFTRLTPLQKERIVRALRAKGHVVGFLGDGINDAAALHAADIGISVDSAVDIAKESADIILLEKSLLVLHEGVVEGRRTFANMLKYLKMTVSSNFGNVLSVLVASLFLPFLPMLPIQLLLQNLLYDFSQMAVPFDRVDEDMLQKPLVWTPEDIARFMLYFGPISSLFDLITFAILWFGFGIDHLAVQGVFQTGWFLVGLFTQTIIVHMIRTPHIPFLESRSAPLLMIASLLIMSTGLILTLGPWAPAFHFAHLPAAFFPVLAGIVLGYMVFTQAMKGFYVRRYGWR